VQGRCKALDDDEFDARIGQLLEQGLEVDHRPRTADP
jgi:hypothetical protein